MASVEDCDSAFRVLAKRLSASDPDKRSDLDRTLTCRLPDIAVIFAGHLHDGQLTDIRQVDDAKAQVKLTMSSDTLIDLVEGRLKFAPAWASGRIKLDAGVFDLIKLRSLF
jgi:alkyl sulfatase BDS1-like metallo-beta-lactamase superfamily hydrolase